MSFNNFDEIREVLEDVTFNDWEFHVKPFGDEDGHHYLQVQFVDLDFSTGEQERQYCRKWSLSLHMTVSEVVYTAFKAVMAAMEHEAREQFRFKGAMVLGPHVDVEQLVDLTKMKAAHDHRTGQWVKPTVEA